MSHQINCHESVNANRQSCLELRSAIAAEHSATHAQRAEQISWISASVSLVTLIAFLITVLQGRAALKRASDANRISEGTSKRQLRAYVSVKGLNFEWKFHILNGERMFHIWAEMENSGETPTRDLKFIVGRCATEADDVFAIIPGPGDYSQRSSLGPRQIVRTPSHVISESEVEKFFRGEEEFFFIGAAFYDDVFLESWETRFMCRVHFSKTPDADFPDFINWQMVGSHNCADEEGILAKGSSL